MIWTLAIINRDLRVSKPEQLLVALVFAFGADPHRSRRDYSQSKYALGGNIPMLNDLGRKVHCLLKHLESADV